MQKITRKKVKAFLEGTWRKGCMNHWYSKWLVRRHIKEQYLYRFVKAKPECHQKGHCISCGCKMPAVLLANKPCRVNCYGPMLDKKQWKKFKDTNMLDINKIKRKYEKR